MFISRECDYAIRIVRDLAGGEKKFVKAICDNEHIPQQYAYKILKKLEKSHIVKSFRGANGGYQLDKNIDEITIYDILISIDNGLCLNECMKDNAVCSRNNPEDPCSVHKYLLKLQDNLIDVL